MGSQGNEGSSSVNVCANGCGSLVLEENLNYCENCFQVLLAEEQAAIAAAERAETAACLNETNPGENWVKAQKSTISLNEWISIIRSNERERQMKDSPLSFSELLDIIRRNDHELDINMESSSTVPPQLTMVSESDQVNGRGGAQQARVVRCPVCRKKVGAVEFTSKCGGVFCMFHRLSEDHECSYDYEALGRREIAEANPVIKRDKVKKI